jgi:hypothetical protein
MCRARSRARAFINMSSWELAGCDVARVKAEHVTTPMVHGSGGSTMSRYAHRLHTISLASISGAASSTLAIFTPVKHADACVTGCT